MRKIKIWAAAILAVAVCCCSVSGQEVSPETFQVDKEELEFLYEFCSQTVIDSQYYSEEFLSGYQQALDSAESAIENYQQEQAEEAYWNLYTEFNRACVYSEVPGDFNGDSIFDIKDCTLAQKCIASLEPMNPYHSYKLGTGEEQSAGIKTVTAMQSSMAGHGEFKNSESFETLKNNVETRDISVNMLFYQAFQERNDNTPDSNGIKIYLSPSNQDANIYAAGNTNEMIQCNRIAQAAEIYLLEHGFDVKRAPENQDMYVTIDESNAWGADLHVPIHTNASPGTPFTGGTMIMLFDFSDLENTKVARSILDSLSVITPGPDHTLCTRPDLHELSDINAMSVYVECEYHDTVEGALFIINNTDEIAKAIAQGICNYYGVEW